MHTPVRGGRKRHAWSTLLLLVVMHVAPFGAFAQTSSPVPQPSAAKKVDDEGAGTAAVTLAPAPESQASTTNPTDDDAEMVVLSPFVVSAEDDVGYVASSSLAGSRLNTSLRDTGATINVLTAEFLQDLGAFDFEDALAYAGNVQDNQDFGNRADGNDAMFSYRYFRVRGMGATLTRNYFPWELATDNYNVERIEEQRGPNSILFGIGSAGGVINAMTKRGLTDRNINRFTFVAGSFDTYRGMFDFNRHTDGKNFAIRLNGVYSSAGSFKLFAENETKRLHLATTWRLTPTLQLYVDAEIGKIDQVLARYGGIIDGITTWHGRGSQTLNAPVSSAADLANYGVTRNAANVARITYLPQTGQLFDMRGQNVSAGTSFDLMDESIVDFAVNPYGPSSIRTADFKNVTVTLDKQIAENTFLQLAGNYQDESSLAHVVGQGRFTNNQIFADPHNFLPGGAANPHAGDIMFEGDRWGLYHSDRNTKNARASLSQTLDFGKWGNYQIAVMGEYNDRLRENTQEIEVWEGKPFSAAAPENQANVVFRRNYATDGKWDTYNIWGPAVTGLLSGLTDPTNPSRTLSSTYVAFSQGGLNYLPEEQRSILAGMQARYLNGRLIAGVGFRKDDLEYARSVAQRDPVTGEWSLDAPGVTVLEDETSGNTRTLGLVGHVTNSFSLFWNLSNTLGLPASAARILPDGNPAPPPEGDGMDFGFSISALEGKLVLRASGYVTELTDGTRTGGPGAFASTTNSPTVYSNNMLASLLAAGRITQSDVDAHTVDQNGATFDQEVKGFEVSLVGNPTRNWRLNLQYSYTDGEDSEIAPEVKAWAREELPYYLQFPDEMVTSGLATPMTVRDYVNQWVTNAEAIFRGEGVALSGQRRHKVAFFTRYNFTEGPLKRLFIGGGHRYQSNMVLGVRPDYSIIWGNSFWYTDLLAGYTTKKFGPLKSGIRLQLNVSNIFDRTVPTVNGAQVLASGDVVYNRIRLVEPIRWRLTAGFDF